MAPSASGIYKRFVSTSRNASVNTFASSIPSATTTTGNKSSSYPPGPPNESPQEKVARLRAASRRAKELASTSYLDSAIERGRRIADKAHRIFAYGLIGFAGISAVIAVYGGVDLVIHNRRQKRSWIDRELKRLQDAREAFLRGDPSAEQLHLLQQERAGEEMVEKSRKDKESRRQESLWGKGKAILRGFGSSSSSSSSSPSGGREGDIGKSRTVEDEARYGRVAKSPTNAAASITNDQALSSETRYLDDYVPTTTPPIGRRGEGGGGPLDTLAANLTRINRQQPDQNPDYEASNPSSTSTGKAR